jgi:hypothetical protein
MAAVARIAAPLARLLRRPQPRTASVDSLGVVLAAASETGAVITVPGLAAWLGWTPPEPDDAVNSYDAYLLQLSQEAS